jgi:TolB-like protein
MSLYSELRRRNVFGMVVLYVVGAWLVVQVADSTFPGWCIPEASIRYVVIAALAGLPIALVFSWRFDVTAKGIKRTPSVHEGTTGLPLKAADHVLLVGLSAVAIVMIAVLTQRVLETRDCGPAPRLDPVFDPPPKSIGVLPFENMSDDPEQAWFSAGVAVELSDRLAQIKVLQVIARETMKIFERPVDVGEVAREVNAKYVLDGSVRRAGDRLRIVAQLNDGKDNTLLWSQTYERELTPDNLFDIQTDIANAIADEMKIAIDQTGQPDSAPTANMTAYDAYLKALESMSLRDGEESDRYLKHALRLDDNFAPAHARLAIVTMWNRGSRQIPREELRQIVEAHLDRADELQPGMAETYAGRSLLAVMSRDDEAAIDYAQKALEINPSYLDAMNTQQAIYRRLGQYRESETILKKMLQVDPLSVAAHWNYTEVLWETGRCKEGHEHADLLMPRRADIGFGLHTMVSFYCGELRDSLEWDLKLDFSMGIGVFIAVHEYAEANRAVGADHMRPFLLVLEGRIDEAVEIWDRRVRQNPESVSTMDDASDGYYFARRFDKALPVYERLLAVTPPGQLTGREYPLISTLRFAFTRRISGDEAGAQEIADIVRKEYAKRDAAGKRDYPHSVAAAMIAVLDNDPERAVEELRTGIQDRGLRVDLYFDEPILETLRSEPGFIEVRKELDAIVAVEHAKILQLICFNNPVPNEWRPLPETCEGVVEETVF